MKDTITLEGRVFDCTKLVLRKYGLDDHTLRKLVKADIVPGPVTIGNKNFLRSEGDGESNLGELPEVN